MSRSWNEFVALLGDLVPGGVPTLALVSLLLAALVGVLWYSWPAWLPSRWPWTDWAGRARSRTRFRRWRFRRPRLGRLRFRWRRRRRRTEPVIAPDLAADQVPDLPATVLALTADDLAAAGRYAEAVRERLRAIVRELVERHVVAPRLGSTVNELAREAGQARPTAAPPLDAAAGLFSDIWYGQRPATVGDDEAMRGHAATVRTVLDGAVDPAAPHQASAS